MNGNKRPQPEPGKATRLRLRAALVLCALIMPVVNILGIMAIDPLARIMIDDEVMAIIDQVSSRPEVRFANQVLPTGLMALALVLYLIPLYRKLWNPDIDAATGLVSPLPRRLIRGTLNLPFLAALATSLGWILGALVIPLAAPGYGVSLTDDFLYEYFAHSFTLFGFSFVISYYCMEVIVRNLLLPACLKENAAAEAGAWFSLSIAGRLAVFAVACFLLPMLVMVTTIGILNNHGNNTLGRDLVSILVIGVPVFALIIIAITVLKSLTIQTPLRQLTKAASEIGKGNFQAEVTVTSNDEIGRLSAAFNTMAKGLAERERMRSLFGKVVDPRVRDNLLATDAAGIGTEGQQREATVVFFDLAGFTAFSESMPPATLVKILNLYFEAVTRSVESMGGMVNKFIGDGVLAVFGVPVDLPGRDLQALKAVQHTARRLATINTWLAANQLPQLSFRAGIHSGTVLAGIVGTRDRMEYTVIGDAVNVASRLESLGKELGAPVVISGDSLHRALETAGLNAGPTASQSLRIGNLRISPRGPVAIRGRANPLELYTASVVS